MSEINLKENTLGRKSRVIKPFIDIHGKEYPFGKVGEDGVYKKHYKNLLQLDIYYLENLYLIL